MFGPVVSIARTYRSTSVSATSVHDAADHLPRDPSMSFLLRLFVLAWLCLPGAGAQAAAPLLLDDSQAMVEAWPSVSMLSDPSQALGIDEVLRRADDFVPPTGARANLGVRHDAVWLRLPLRALGRGQWVLEVDYAPLNRIDVYLLQQGRLWSTHRLGNDQPFDQRPLAARAHALALDLPPGQDAELLLRVRSSSAMVLPIRFHRADTFLAHEARGQLLQGLMLGVALALLVYSAVNGAGLRDPLFAFYAVMLLGVGVFLVSYTGVGQQHLWNEYRGVLVKLAPMGVLLAVAGGSLFAAAALGTAEHHPRVTLGLRVIAALSLLLLLLAAVDGLDYRAAQTAATLLGPMPMLLALRLAIAQARAGDRAARMMLLGWGAYLVGALTLAGLLRGVLPATYWMQHLFQFTTLLEMLAWMRVLSLRIEGMRREAERVELEHRALHSLAHTDPLTGLPNRRGLSAALASALPASHADHALAVYLLDLDGFKPVNDRLGHDAGDSLLVQVAHRLRSLVRAGDVVARLGGDEFVVMSPGMKTEADAQTLGRKLLDAFRQPFDVVGQRCSVGLTIGYALAPLDGRDAADLLKRADAAMFSGKQAGRHCLRRGVPLPA
jgi:diguanylate cyclase (GGDEF)-like protein